MKNIALLLFTLLLNSKTFAAHISLEPSGLIFKETKILLNFTTQQQRKVFDVLYKDKPIFQISENLIQSINSIGLISDQNKTVILYKMPMSDNIISTNEELNKVLFIPDVIYQFVIVSADEFILISEGHAKKKFKLVLLLNSCKKKFKIHHYIYQELEKTKLVAQNQNYKIKVNLNFFSNKSNFNNIDNINKHFLLIDP